MNNLTTLLTLDNGLTVHLKEIHTAPIISTWVWYRVGSRNETRGRTGISHWVEHMQFKGTDKYPPSYLDREISRVGGIWNAMTYLDWTTYFETLPAHLFEISLALEADRMTNSRFIPDEVERERTVVISEREGNENEPLFLLGEAVTAAAFSNHPYAMEVIGLKGDLETITRDQLYEHYRAFYHPGNAVLAIAGDFATDAMLEQIRHHFGSLSSQKIHQNTAPPEPPLHGEQRVSVTGPGETSFLQISYRAPAANDPDFFELTVLDSLLTGPNSLNMFGSGGTSNRTSRLYRALVETEIAISCNGTLQATCDPYLYSLDLTIPPNRTPEEVLTAVDQEIDKILETPISPEEIERAIKQAKALFVYSSEAITNQAFWLGFSEMFASYDWFENYIPHLSRVTPESLLLAAQKYLVPENRVVGIYIPQERQA